MRNFEDSGTVLYKVNYGPGLYWTNGSTYALGTTLPFDVGGVSYSATAVALLRKYWEQAWILPLT